MSTEKPATREEAIEKLRDLMKDIKFCMLTSYDHTAGTLHSRPMTLQETQFDGDLWFFTSKDSATCKEIRQNQQVNVTFANPGDNKYVSVSGSALLVEDRTRAEKLWNPFYKAWFPKGLDDPNLTLLKIEIDRAEYWDSPNGMITTALAFMKRLAGGDAEIGEHEKIRMR